MKRIKPPHHQTEWTETPEDNQLLPQPERKERVPTREDNPQVKRAIRAALVLKNPRPQRKLKRASLPPRWEAKDADQDIFHILIDLFNR